MRTIGLIGGMSWESTAEYYKQLNRLAAARFGGLNSAKVLLYSVNFAEIEALQRADRWDLAAARLSEVAVRLQEGGADVLVLCTNTMHLVADAIQSAVRIPLLHIADSLGKTLRAQKITQVGLLATRFTMERDFYRARLAEKFGIEVVIPGEKERTEVHRVIFEELCRGKTVAASREYYLETIRSLHAAGAQAVILGCTEIGLLVNASMTSVPLFDTTLLHANDVFEWATEGAPGELATHLHQ